MSKTFSDDLMAKAGDVVETVVNKQLDYGKNNILNSVIDPRLAIAVRLQDKIARLANLSSNKQDPKNESLMDTAKDIAGYGLILMMLIDDTFTLPMVKEEDLDG